ncbi:hypothetical protein PTTG_29725, partial [Puccinia triticina 1-1 BBBD Race 1]
SAAPSKITYSGAVRSTTPLSPGALLSDPAPRIVKQPIKKVPTAASESLRTVTKKPRVVKKPKSPKVVPPEWDQEVTKEPEANTEIPSPFLKARTVPTTSAIPAKPVPTKPKIKKTVPTADPFKSAEPVSKLIDRDPSSSLNQIKIKKVIPKANQKPQVEPKFATTSNQTSTSGPSVKKSVFDDGSFDQKTRDKLENYFVPQGRTVVSNYLTTSSLIPSSEDSRESYPPAASSDLDIITGATAQLCSKRKILPGPLEADMLKNLNPWIHPMLQGLKSQLDGRNQAKEKDDDNMMILCLEAAMNLNSTIVHIISPEQFRSLYGDWDIQAEWEDYQSGPKHRDYLRKRGQEPTPTPGPQPMELWSPTPPAPTMELPTPRIQEKPLSSIPQPSGHQPMHHASAGVSSLDRSHSTAKCPKSKSEPLRPAAKEQPEAKRQNRRHISHQMSIHCEMIRLNRTTQAQYQALESLRNQNGGYDNRRQLQEDEMMYKD